MSNTILHPTVTNGKIQTGLPVQTGPVYHCPECNAVVRHLIPYRDIISPGGHLDAWGDHIAYLDLPTACKQALHPARVAVFGAAAVPLIFPGDPSALAAQDQCTRHHHVTTEECVALLQQAIAQIIREVGPHKPAHDPAASIVYRLVAGILAPQAAIAEIREMTQSAILAALNAQPQPDFTFSEETRS